MSDVVVAGRLDRSLADFERACLVHLADEQRRPNPDNALIAVLCDAVRLKREHCEWVATSGQTQAEHERALDALWKTIRAASLTGTAPPDIAVVLHEALRVLAPYRAVLKDHAR